MDCGAARRTAAITASSSDTSTISVFKQDIKPGTAQVANDKEKKPKANLDEQSSSKKKKKKGLGKLNPF